MRRTRKRLFYPCLVRSGRANRLLAIANLRLAQLRATGDVNGVHGYSGQTVFDAHEAGTRRIDPAAFMAALRKDCEQYNRNHA